MGKSLNLSVPQSPFPQNGSIPGCLPSNSEAPGMEGWSTRGEHRPEGSGDQMLRRSRGRKTWEGLRASLLPSPCSREGRGGCPGADMPVVREPWEGSFSSPPALRGGSLAWPPPWSLLPACFPTAPPSHPQPSLKGKSQIHPASSGGLGAQEGSTARLHALPCCP